MEEEVEKENAGAYSASCLTLEVEPPENVYEDVTNEDISPATSVESCAKRKRCCASNKINYEQEKGTR